MTQPEQPESRFGRLMMFPDEPMAWAPLTEGDLHELAEQLGQLQHATAAVSGAVRIGGHMVAFGPGPDGDMVAVVRCAPPDMAELIRRAKDHS